MVQLNGRAFPGTELMIVLHSDSMNSMPRNSGVSKVRRRSSKRRSGGIGGRVERMFDWGNPSGQLGGGFSNRPIRPSSRTRKRITTVAMARSVSANRIPIHCITEMFRNVVVFNQSRNCVIVDRSSAARGTDYRRVPSSEAGVLRIGPLLLPPALLAGVGVLGGSLLAGLVGPRLRAGLRSGSGRPGGGGRRSRGGGHLRLLRRRSRLRLLGGFLRCGAFGAGFLGASPGSGLA